MQLRLVQTPTVPLQDALAVVAAQWSIRLGHEVRVHVLPHSGGYRIGASS